jgi:hypothetical protein
MNKRRLGVIRMTLLGYMSLALNSKSRWRKGSFGDFGGRSSTKENRKQAGECPRCLIGALKFGESATANILVTDEADYELLAIARASVGREMDRRAARAGRIKGIFRGNRYDSKTALVSDSPSIDFNDNEKTTFGDVRRIIDGTIGHFGYDRAALKAAIA